VWGALREIQRDPLGLIVRVRERCGDVVRVPVAHREIVLVSSASGVQHVLVEHTKNYPKAPIAYAELKSRLGSGLVTSGGELWARQRRLIQPAFHRARIAGFGSTMARCTAEMLDGWSDRLDANASIDVARAMMELTWRILGETLLSLDVRDEVDEVGQALELLLQHAADHNAKLLPFPHWVPTPQNRRAARALARLDGVVQRAIAAGRRQAASGEVRADLLAMLIDATDDKGAMSDAQLRDELLTLMAAGHETTSNALTWALWRMAKHPEVAAAVRKEVADVTQGAAPSFEDLPRMPLVERAVQETLRLHPPVWTLMRQAVEDDVIDGYSVRAGTVVAVCTWGTHRHPAYWPDPEAFDPARFVEGHARPKGAYFPFSAGPRKCIGDTFAFLETKLLLATMLQRAHFELLPETRAEAIPSITLRPKPLVLRVQRAAHANP
jgi:cytochrome P450